MFKPKLLLLLERTVALRRVHAFQTSKAVLKSGYQVQQIRRNLAILPGPNEQASGIHLLRDERDQFGSNEFSIGTQSIPLPPLQPPTSTPTPTLPLPAAPHCSTETQRNSEQLVLAGLVFTCVSQSSPAMHLAHAKNAYLALAAAAEAATTAACTARISGEACPCVLCRPDTTSLPSKLSSMLDSSSQVWCRLSSRTGSAAAAAKPRQSFSENYLKLWREEMSREKSLWGSVAPSLLVKQMNGYSTGC